MKSAMGAGKVPPDGGWGWMIVAAYAICNIVIAPLITNFGLIFKDKFAEMKMPAADISFIMNINSAFGMSLGLINGPLLRNFGYRKVAIVAGILSSMGVTLTSFSNSFGAFILTYGIITAAGLGLALSSFSLALNSYFKENRNKATGISMTLTGLGPILYPPMISALLIFYGNQGCVLILGAICMHIIMAALLLQPVKWHMKDPPALQDIESSSLVGRSSGASKYNEKSFHAIDRNKNCKEKHRTIIEADHEIDAQSIYGYDQMSIIRRPTQTHLPISELDNDDDELKQSIINSSKHTFDRSISHVITRQIERDNCASTDVLVPAPKLRRWFEAGSDESVHLGSSDNIFSEKIREQPVLVGIAEADSDKDEPKDSNGVEAKKNGNRTDYENTTMTEESNNKRSISKIIVRFFDLDLLKDKIYVNIMLGMSLAIFAELNFSILTPFIFSDLQYSTFEIASLMSTLAVADILSRFTSPFIGDYFDQSPRIMYMISLVMLIIVRMGVFAVSTYQGMLCVCIALGLAKGVRTVYMSLVIPTHVPIERLAAASGLQMVMNGAVLIIFGPIVGLIRDITGSYSRCIIFINLITLTALVMWAIEMTCTKYIKRKPEEHK